MADGLRKVPMASGFGLSFVQPETGSQILCQALSTDQWQRLLGADARRVPNVEGTDSRCKITAGQLSIELSLYPSPDVFRGVETIAGRPAAVREDSGVAMDVAIADRVALTLGSVQWPVLTLRTTGDLALARKVLADLVPVLAKPGGPAVKADTAGLFPFVATPFSHDEFLDLPKPVQALQLCTLVQEKFGAQVVSTSVFGNCDFRLPDGRSQSIGMMSGMPIAAAYNSRIAGRPAAELGEPDLIRLRDGVPVDLAVGGGNRDFAEKLVPLLV
ncbi:hypothetical protein [Actinocrispum wychmicini]|uniref:Uncharacterized protein n=1 Tax=Actinocrispum wychmicini TaxID=1213861 RepID=A0A4R2JUS7_9PSEU|nr:hypothetical protein [Actinocrispum wychmicini]TCO62802.1 hypothetical protein EV192_102941 [Actinocrispum wychmicini]